MENNIVIVHNNVNDNLSRLWFVISNMVPPVGFYLYFRHRARFPNKARKALISALTGIPVGIIGGYIINTYLL